MQNFEWYFISELTKGMKLRIKILFTQSFVFSVMCTTIKNSFGHSIVENNIKK